MKVGDMIKRIMPEEFPHRRGDSRMGVIIELHHRSLQHYSAERIAKDPIRMITVLQGDGNIKKWYARHAEVTSESR